MCFMLKICSLSLNYYALFTVLFHYFVVLVDIVILKIEISTWFWPFFMIELSLFSCLTWLLFDSPNKLQFPWMIAETFILASWLRNFLVWLFFNVRTLLCDAENFSVYYPWTGCVLMLLVIAWYLTLRSVDPGMLLMVIY